MSQGGGHHSPAARGKLLGATAHNAQFLAAIAFLSQSGSPPWGDLYQLLRTDRPKNRMDNEDWHSFLLALS